jgi:hypothetical protein
MFALTLGVAAPVAAEDAHHPQGSAQTQAQPAPSQSPTQRPGMGMMGQGNMMGDGMMAGGNSRMMPMMGMRQMMQGGQHIEGRLAFVKAELKITSAQEKAWDDFANAVRQASAKIHAAGGMETMSGMADSATPPQIAEQYEKQLSARLEAIRMVRPALESLYANLNDEQKKTFAQVHMALHGII